MTATTSIFLDVVKDLPAENYAKHFEGLHPNPVGGAEAIISHLIVAKYKIPAAHAPLSNLKEMTLKTNIILSLIKYLIEESRF